jgi:hypothetical protein
MTARTSGSTFKLALQCGQATSKASAFFGLDIRESYTGQQAASNRQQPQAASNKQQAIDSSHKPQATSSKQ